MYYKYEILRDGTRLIRVNREKARKCYVEGMTIYVMPVKLRPSMWVDFFKGDYPDRIKDLSWEEKAKYFDAWINEVIFYNCTNETGNYLKFYIKDND